MPGRCTPRALGMVCLLCLGTACDRREGSPGDGGSDAEAVLVSDAERDREDGTTPEGADAERRPESGVQGGPLTLVVRDIELLTDRACDLDGDGRYDNAVGNLPPSEGPVFAMAVTALIRGDIESGARTVMHSPWLDDVTTPNDPEATLILYLGDDADQPSDPSDDFSGDETYFVNWRFVDACGEPVNAFPAASLVEGELLATSGTLPLPMADDLVVRNIMMWGSVEPAGSGADIWLCGYFLIGDLGLAEGIDPGSDLSMLDTMSAGGAALGFPMLPGIDPDVDLDGDGLERLITDETGRIASCIDGDLTPIEGRECWRDERIADAFSVTMRIDAVAARHGGLEPGWEQEHDEPCDSAPEQSLWDAR